MPSYKDFFEKTINEASILFKNGELDLSVLLEELNVCQEELRSQEEEIESVNRRVEREHSKFLALSQNPVTAVLITNKIGVVNECNQACTDLLGLEKHRLTGKPFISFVSLDERILVRQYILKSLELPGSIIFETKLIARQNSSIPVKIAIHNYSRDGNEPVELIWSIHDTSFKQRYENGESQLLAVMQSSSDAIIGTCPRGIINSWNDAAETLYGYTAQEMIGKSLTTMIPVDLKPIVFRSFVKMKKTEPLCLEFKIQTFFGKEKKVAVKMTPVVNSRGELIGCTSIFRDITQQHLIERDKRQLLSKVVDIQERERARIAKELHDETGQHLTALSLTIAAIKNNYDNTIPIDKKLKHLQSMVKELSKELHDIAWEMRPSALDRFGLLAVLQHYTDTWSNRTGIAVDLLTTDVDERLEPILETTMFRILQESFTNISKHANASRVGVILRRYRSDVHLVIEDNGEGFDCNADPRDKLSMGLSGMRERAALAGGTFQIESGPGHGTAIFVCLPLKQDESDDENISS